MSKEQRFKGKLSEEYRLVERAYPHFQRLQEAVAEAVAGYTPHARNGPVTVLEIGCGDGMTSEVILSSRENLHLIALDNEPDMVAKARTNLEEWTAPGVASVIEADALAWLQQQEPGSIDVVATALTLHNLHKDYRAEVLPELFRVLKPGGLFVNADKYAPEGQARFDALVVQLGRFFDTFLPAEKYDLLKEWVLHNVADQAPDRVMTEAQARRDMAALGFTHIQVSDRHNMEAVLTAEKPAR